MKIRKKGMELKDKPKRFYIKKVLKLNFKTQNTLPTSYVGKTLNEKKKWKTK